MTTLVREPLASSAGADGSRNTAARWFTRFKAILEPTVFLFGPAWVGMFWLRALT